MDTQQKSVESPVIWVPLGSGTEYFSRLLRGISRFRRERGNWVLNYPAEDVTQDPDPEVKGALLWSSEQEPYLSLSRKIPCVQLSNYSPHAHIPAVTADDLQVGRRAAEHFLARGFQSFFFLGTDDAQYSRQRCEGFRRTLTQKKSDVRLHVTLHKTQQAMKQENYLDQFFAELRKEEPPWALFCADDWWARFILEQSRRYDLVVPGELAVLGVNNEISVCEISDTPVSSVDLPAEEIGYQGARLLYEMIHGLRPEKMHQVIPVQHVVTRESTDIHAVPDPVVSKALSLMQSGLGIDLNLDALASSCGVSRRKLERLFQEVLHISPYQRLTQFRMDRAKFLLRSSSLPVSAIADECGFTEQKQLSVRFKHTHGMTPMEWRKQHRPKPKPIAERV